MEMVIIIVLTAFAYAVYVTLKFITNIKRINDLRFIEKELSDSGITQNHPKWHKYMRLGYLNRRQKGE